MEEVFLGELRAMYSDSLQTITNDSLLAEFISNSDLNMFLSEVCYEDDPDKNKIINDNLNNYPVLYRFVHESQALRASCMEMSFDTSILIYLITTIV